jgi:magnesium transporter
MDDRTREEASALLHYREDVAGGLMNPCVVRLRPDETIEQALTYVRQQVTQAEMVYCANVLDKKQRLLGIVGLKELGRADRSTRIADVMMTGIIKVHVTTDQKQAAQLLSTNITVLKKLRLVAGKGRR